MSIQYRFAPPYLTPSPILIPNTHTHSTMPSKRRHQQTPSPSSSEIEHSDSDAPSSPPRKPPPSKVRKTSLSFADSLKKASSHWLAKRGGSTSTRSMISQLASQVEENMVTLASQETNKGLRKISSSMKPKKASSDRTTSKKSTKPAKASVLTIGSVLMLPIGVKIVSNCYIHSSRSCH